MDSSCLKDPIRPRHPIRIAKEEGEIFRYEGTMRRYCWCLVFKLDGPQKRGMTMMVGLSRGNAACKLR